MLRLADKVRIAVACLAVGLTSSCASLLFSFAVDVAHGAFLRCQGLLFLLPCAGVFSYGLYRCLEVPFSMGTADTVLASSSGKAPRFQLAPAIFSGTCLTIVAGGSVGKEAAALQIGAALADPIQKVFGIADSKCVSLLVMCGMSAALCVLLGTPIAACLFAFELFRPKEKSAFSAVIVFLSALIGASLASLVSADSLRYGVEAPLPSQFLVGFVAVLTLAGCAVGSAFCLLLKKGRKATSSLSVHPLAVLIVGGLVYIALAAIVQDASYAGTGMSLVRNSLEGCISEPLFVGKIVFTALLLVCGFKGGEIMPVLCVGATLGAYGGYLFGVDSGFSAVVGLASVFAVCTKCPAATLFLVLESFGAGMALWTVAPILFAFAVTRRFGLYPNTGT